MAKREKKASTGEKKPSGIAKIPKNLKFLGGLLLKKMARGGAGRLRSNAEEVNRLNVFPVPDGDTGDNMRLTIESGIAAIEGLDSDDLAEVMRTLSHGMLLGARGNSGVILSQFFAGMAKGLDTAERADPEALGRALELGVQQAYSSVMTPTEGTILTVAREAVEYAVSRITPSSTIRTLFADLVKEMKDSLERTPETLAVLKEAGVVDSGGAGLLYIMEGFNRVLNGEEPQTADETETPATAGATSPKPMAFAFGPDSEMTYGYCTEMLLQLQNKKTDIPSFDLQPLKEFLCGVGDSVVVFQTDSIVKLHVHTFTPERVLAECRRYGELLTIKIENMSVQHTALSEDTPTEAEKPDIEAITPTTEQRKPYGVVAVCNGEGVESLYRDLGTDVIVHGGQTHNPSANDFLEAFAKVNADCIFVLPNKGNIRMAAQQAAELDEDARVMVVRGKSIGAGYVALSSVTLEGDDPDAIYASMEEAVERISTGFISPSIRDAEMNGLHIHEHDTIGILEKEIVVCEATCLDAVKKLASMLLELPDKFMLTVFCGADAVPAESDALEEYLAARHPSSEVYFINGGQEIYPYILIAE